MKIGIDARMYRSSAAGIGRYTRNLIENLLKIDHDDQFVFFMTSADAKEARDQLPVAWNYRIVIADIPHYSIAEQAKLAKIIEKEKLDLMHFTNFNHPMNYQGKFIVTIHDLTLFHFPETAKKTNFIKQLGFKLVMKNAIQKSAKIIAVSKFTQKDILKFSKVEPAKIIVIYEAADDKIMKIRNPKSARSAWHSIRNKYNIKDESIILYVGQFRPHKNIIGLLGALSKIKEFRPSAKLALLGKIENKYVSEVKNTVDKLGLKGDTVMPGFVDDRELAAWYQLADVFVFPSFYEGFGLPGLEAMMAGVPVASSNSASLPEIFQDAALYFDPNKPRDMADKIGKILEDDTIKKRLVKQGFEVAKKYSWEKCARETLKIYKEISN